MLRDIIKRIRGNESTSSSYPTNERNTENETLQVLVIDSDPKWFRRVEGFFKSTTGRGTVVTGVCHHVTALSEALSALDGGGYDVILTDLNLRDATGFLVIDQLTKHACDSPILVLSDMPNWSTIIEAARVGISDFLSKKNLGVDLLIRSVLGAIERGKLVRELRSSRSMYRRLTQMMPVGMVQLEHDLSITYANETFVNYFQITDLKTQKLRGLQQFLSPSSSWEDVLRVLNGAEDFYEFEAKGNTPSSTNRTFLVVTRRLDYQGDIKSGYQCVVWDLSVQKQNAFQEGVERQFNFVQKRLSKVFSELNNALSAIVLDASNIDAETDDTIRRGMLHRIQDSVHAARSTMKPFLSKTDQVVTRWETMQLNQLIHTCLENAIPSGSDSLTCQISLPKEDRPVYVEPSLIQSVISILLQNAIESIQGRGIVSVLVKVVSNGFVTDKISGNLIDANDWVQIVVNDNGCGFDGRLASKVIEPLYTTKGKDHAGLGLSEAWKIIKAHHGFLSIDSAEGEGTTVEMLIPIVDDHVKDSSDQMATLKTTAFEGGVMIVEDEETLQDALESLLSSMGLQVKVFSNGPEALAFYTDNFDSIKLIITDYLLPIMDGEVLIRHIRKISHSVRIVLTTGLETRSDIPNLKDLYIDDLIMKPYTPYKIRQVIASALNFESRKTK